MPLWSASALVSKSGAVTKERAPVEALIVNRAWSAPPTMLYAWVAPASWSVAVTVVTAVVFSATFTAAVAPPPSLVMTGAVLALTTRKEVDPVSGPGARFAVNGVLSVTATWMVY